MGRQKGEAGRTKNRPSSSSRAAFLLPSSGATNIGFGGYIGSSRLIEGQDPVVYLDADSELGQNLKKLRRKDPVTKIRALRWLCTVLKERTEDAALITPQWALEYKKLIFDNNREIRKAAHETMSALVSCVGRGLAPHLKSLMGPWWFCQFDPVSEISYVARLSLQVAFPAQEKRLDALMLYANEIFEYLYENLKLTPRDIKDKTISEDELHAIYNQVISCSLLAFSTLLDVFMGMHMEMLDVNSTCKAPRHASMARDVAVSASERICLDQRYFGTFFKSQNADVRSATYSTVGCLIKYIPNAFNQSDIKSLSSLVFGAFQDKDPACYPSMWDMVLLFVREYPDCWLHVDILKILSPQLWHLLSNGSAMLKEVMSSSIVQLLDSIPPKAVDVEQFLLSFLQKFWVGRNLFQIADLSYFFCAFKDCFTWGMFSTPKFTDGEDLFRLEGILVDQILLDLLFKEYIFDGLPGSSPIVSSGGFDCGVPVELERNSLKYNQELGKCIIEILCKMSSRLPDLVSIFSNRCLKYCMEMFESHHPSECVDHTIDFFKLLKENVTQKGEDWPMSYLVMPFVSNCFQLVKTSDSANGMKLMSAMFIMFGSHTLMPALSDKKERPFCENSSENSDLDYFLQIFKNDIVPWCLENDDCFADMRLEYLIALFDEMVFQKQFSIVIAHAAKLDESFQIDCYHQRFDISILAIFLEKMRKKVGNSKIDTRSWTFELLDNLALSFVVSPPSPRSSCYHFLRAVLGGSDSGEVCFVSISALKLIVEEILKKIVSPWMKSTSTWLRNALSLFMPSNSQDEVDKSSSSFHELLGDAKFGMKILEQNFCCLKCIHDDSRLIISILAGITIIDWNMVCSEETTGNKHSETENPYCSSINLMTLRELVGSVCKKGSWFHRNDFFEVVAGLRYILLGTIRFFLSEIGNCYREDIVNLAIKFTTQAFDLTIFDHNGEQHALDQLLSECEFWPQWVHPHVKDGVQSTSVKSIGYSPDNVIRHEKFVVFVDKLISSLGASRVIVGAHSERDVNKGEVLLPDIFRRMWIPVELLCTWEWHGGSASAMLLPILSAYADTRECSVMSLFDILFEGAATTWQDKQSNFLGPWRLLDDEIQNVRSPFLRALLAFLSFISTKECVGNRDKQVAFLQYFLRKASDCSNFGRSYLGILPFVLNVVVQPLLLVCFEEVTSTNNLISGPLSEEDLHRTFSSWLHKALTLPLMMASQPAENDGEEWVQVALSCFPLESAGGLFTLEQAIVSNINQMERRLLLYIFRYHRTDTETSDSFHKEIALSGPRQLLLGRLVTVSVAYCWQYFSQEDLDFVFFFVCRHIEAIGFQMEKIVGMMDAETCTSSDNVEDIRVGIQYLNSSLLSPCKVSVFIVTLLCGLSELPDLEDSDISSFLKSEKITHLRRKMLENVLHLFFSRGVLEAEANRNGSLSMFNSGFLGDSHLWNLVASCKVSSSADINFSSAILIDMKENHQGAISALYSLLFSSRPVAALQKAAFAILSIEQVFHMSILEDQICEQESENSEILVGPCVCLRTEISSLLEKLPSELSQKGLSIQLLGDALVAWALLLTYLQKLSSSPQSSSSSSTWETLIAYVQESASSIILNCIFQFVQLRPEITKRKEILLAHKSAIAAASAKRAMNEHSLHFAMEMLWPPDEDKVASLAGAVYGGMLQLLPAYVCDWFASLRDRSFSFSVEAFTRIWCSPHLLAEEMSKIRKTDFASENFSVAVSKSEHQVTATYRKEETGIDLVIRLPSCYPLLPVDVECRRSLGISDVKRKKWLLSLTAFIRNQNGALAEAIRIWKSNFDKEFEGVEECPICYSIIHHSTHALPRLTCKTCKHKYHSACLYKWLSSSGKTTCPLCQTPFSKFRPASGVV